MSKSYTVKPGSCNDCTLLKECKINKQGIALFLAKLKLKCEDGKMIGVKSDKTSI